MRFDYGWCLSAVAHNFEQVAVRIEEIDAIVVAPIDGLGRFHSGCHELIPRVKEILVAHAESVMTLTKRMSNPRRALS